MPGSRDFFSHSCNTAYVIAMSSNSSHANCSFSSLVARMKCCDMIGNLFRTRKCDGSLSGISVMNNAGSGSTNGFLFGFLSGSVCSFERVGFFASEGQNLSWNYEFISIENALTHWRLFSPASAPTSGTSRSKEVVERMSIAAQNTLQCLFLCHICHWGSCRLVQCFSHR